MNWWGRWFTVLASVVDNDRHDSAKPPPCARRHNLCSHHNVIMKWGGWVLLCYQACVGDVFWGTTATLNPSCTTQSNVKQVFARH